MRIFTDLNWLFLAVFHSVKGEESLLEKSKRVNKKLHVKP